MLFANLFSKKHSHLDTKASNRIAAIKQLEINTDASQAIIQTLLKSDSDHQVRLSALNHCNDLLSLEYAYNHDSNDIVRQAALTRITLLIQEQWAATQTLNQQALALNNHKIITQIISSIHIPDIQITFIEKLTSEADVLPFCSQNSHKVRMAAAQRLFEKNTIKTALNALGNKDQAVTKLLKSRLEKITQDEKNTQELENKRIDLCKNMEQHAKSSYSPLHAAKTESLKQQMHDIGFSQDSSLNEKFEEFLAIAKTQHQHHLDQNQATQAKEQAHKEIDDTLKILAQTIESFTVNAEADRPALAAILKTQKIRFDVASESVDVPSKKQSLFNQNLKKLEDILAHIDNLYSQKEQAISLVKELENSSEEQKAKLIKKLNPLVLTLAQHNYPVDEFTKFISTNIATEKTNTKELLNQKISEINTSLNSGEIEHSHKLLQHTKDFAKEHHLFDNRIALLSEKINELKNWKTFAIEPKKQALIIRMTQLIDANIDLADKANQIKALQHEWKSLGNNNTLSEKKLWDQFKAATTQAYAPCALYYKEQDTRKEENLQKRKILCEQLSSAVPALLTDTHWQKSETFLKTAQAEWDSYTPIDFKKTEILYKEFKDLCKKLYDHTKTLKQKNEQKKLALIEESKALLQTNDEGSIVDTLKKLQSEWKTLPTLGKQKEQALWLNFKANNDAAFEKFKAYKDHEKQQSLNAFNQVQDALKKFTESSLSTETEINTEYKNIETAIRALKKPIEQEKALMNTLKDNKSKHLDEIKKAKQESTKAKLQDKLNQWSSNNMGNTLSNDHLLEIELLLNIQANTNLSPEEINIKKLQVLQKNGLNKLSKERINDEVQKLLQMQADPSQLAQQRSRLETILITLTTL